MKSATATYVAPFGESKTVGFGGLTFEDGKPVEINSHDNPHVFNKLQNHPFFDFTMGKDEPDAVKPKAKRGRPSAADKAAIEAAAAEADRLAKEAAEKAKTAKADLEDLKKAESAKDDAPAAKPAEPVTTDLKAGMVAASQHDFEKDRQDEQARRDAQAKGVQPETAKTDPAV